MKHARKDYQRIQDPENKIGKDEPVFLLRAKDRLMIPTMNTWIAYAQKAKVDKKMIQMVEDFKTEVMFWQQENGCKTPDL